MYARAFSALGVSPLAWISRIPKWLAEKEVVVLVVYEDAVQGVMGGGDRGVLGDNGHLILGLGDSSGAGTNLGDGQVVLPDRSTDLLDDKDWCEPGRINCFKAVTGAYLKPNLA